MKRMLLGLAILAALAAPALAQDGQATCQDVYQIYQTCYEGGSAMDLSGCGYLVQALGPKLLGEEGMSGFSAALSVGMCKRGCEDGAQKKRAMTMAAFRKEFCTSGLK